jgi:hypothetical protein
MRKLNAPITQSGLLQRDSAAESSLALSAAGGAGGATADLSIVDPLRGAEGGPAG